MGCTLRAEQRGEEGRSWRRAAVYKSVRIYSPFFVVEDSHFSMIVISFRKSLVAARGTLLAVIMGYFHVGDESGIKDTRGTGDGGLERVFFFGRLENMNLDLGTGTTHVQDDLGVDVLYWGAGTRHGYAKRKAAEKNDIKSLTPEIHSSIGDRRLSRCNADRRAFYDQ